MLYLNSSSFAEQQLIVFCRAVLIMDDDTLFPMEPLEKPNFHVYSLQKGMMEEPMVPRQELPDVRGSFGTSNVTSRP